MKKKLFTSVFALLLVFSFAGCSCNHTWSDADCLNPAVCTKCEELGDAALGHNWSKATCAAPQTCTRCGATQGVALSHEYGDWSFTNTEMIRTCANCTAEERTEIDREAHLNHLLTGRWDYYGIKMNSKLQTGYYFPWFTYAEYTGDGSLDLIMGLTSQKMVIEYDSYDPETNSYSGNIILESGATSPYILEIGEFCNLLRTSANSSMEIIYCQYNKSHDDLLGTWSVTHGGHLYFFTLNADRTFTGNLGEEVSGQWLMLPDDESGGFGIGGCLLAHEQNGKMATAIGSTIMIESSPGMAEIDAYALMHLKPNSDTTELTFKKITDAELEATQNALAEAPSVIIGTWDSKTVYEWDGKNSTPRIFLDHSLTVREDGTFTLALDRQITGTWSVNGASFSDGVTSYSYKFSYPTAKGSETVSFNTWYDEVTFLYRDARGYSNLISFAKLSEEDRNRILIGPELLPGEYISEKTVYYDSSLKQDVETPETRYTISIFEDGTYTVVLDETVSDQWFFSDLYPGNAHTYAFRHKGSQYESQRLEDGTLVFHCRISGKHLTIYFRPV